MRTSLAIAFVCLLSACAGVSGDDDAGQGGGAGGGAGQGGGVAAGGGQGGGAVGGGQGGGFDAGDDAGLDGGLDDAGQDAGADAGMTMDGGMDAGCFIASTGVFGECMDTSVCTAMSGYSPTPGYCPGPTNIQCCSPTPNVANNPPVPAGWKLMMQSEVTPAMTTWAVAILHDPVTYPMWSTTTMTFGTLLVMSRVEWHPPDFQNGAIHRGVTLYEPV